jgi:hypothetical protein
VGRENQMPNVAAGTKREAGQGNGLRLKPQKVHFGHRKGLPAGSGAAHEMIVDAGGAERVGVTFIPIVNCPIGWRI